MFKQNAFANSLAVMAGVVYLAFYVIQQVAPPFFEYLFNAQFLGGNFANQVPQQDISTFVGVLITVVVTSWVVGHIWAWLYNRFAK